MDLLPCGKLYCCLFNIPGQVQGTRSLIEGGSGLSSRHLINGQRLVLYKELEHLSSSSF